jgi:hypothetical protein
MGNPEYPEPTPERDSLMPERRVAGRRRTVVVATGAAAILGGGAFLAVHAGNARQDSLPEPPSIAAAGASAAAPAMPDVSPAAVASASSQPTQAPVPAATDGSTTRTTTSASTERSSSAAQKEMNKARAKAAADGFPLQRPPEAKDNSATMADAAAVSQWTEPIRNGTVQVTTARRDLTGGAALVLAADRGRSVGDGVSCTDKVRFTRDAPATERPTVLVCWRTSAERSVVTMMATPNGRPSPAANVSIINREWAKLG